MALARGGNVPDAVQFRPEISARIVGPDVVEPSSAVRATEPGCCVSVWSINRTLGGILQEQLVLPGDHAVVRSRGRDRRRAITAIRDQDVPSVALRLKRIQIKGDQIIKKVALDLSAKYVYL